ncbi:MAG: hypothetical protein QW597_00160 [Thermoplasmataceae archaeon]
MGKLTGYILGVSGALLVSYYVLSIYYAPLINWLGPFFGTPIMFLLPILFLLLGNPLAYPVLILAWLFIALMVAVGARKGGKAVGTAFTVYLSILGFLVLSALAIAFGQGVLSGNIFGGSSLSSFGGILANPPAGTNLYSLENEPLIGNLVLIFSSYANILGSNPAGTGSISTNGIISAITNNFLIYMLINFIVFLVASYILGRVIRSFILPRRSFAKAASLLIVMVVLVSGVFVFTDGNGQYPLPIAQSGTAQSTPSHATGISISQAMSLAPYSANSSIGSFTPDVQKSFNAAYYAAGVVGKYGGVYNVYVMAGGVNASGSSSWYNTGAASHSYFTVVLYTYNLSQVISSFASDSFVNGTSSLAGTSTLASILNLVPGIVVVEGFNGSTTQSSSLASQAASGIISESGGSGAKLLISLNVSSNSSLPGFSGSLYVYAGEMAWPGSLNSVISPITGAMNQSGPLTMFENGMSSGYLIPQRTSTSMNGLIMVAGVVNPSLFNSSLLSQFGFNGLNGTLTLDRIVFAGGIFYKADVFHSSASPKTIQYSKIFNYADSVNFTSNNIVYGLTVGYPQIESIAGNNVSGYNFTTYTTIRNFTDPFRMNGINFSAVHMTVPYYLDMGSISLSTNAVFPANISMVIEAASIGKGLYRISTILTNRDTDTLTQLSLSENSTISMYRGYMNLTGGYSYVTAPSLAPGASLNLTYQVSLKNFGSYAIAAPNINYTSSGIRFNVTGSPGTIAVAPPNFLQALVAVEAGAFSFLGNSSPFSVIFHQITPGFYLFELIALLILFLDVYIEVRAYRRWKAVRKMHEEMPPQQKNP